MLPSATISQGADSRIIAAVEMLRSLQADGFSVPLLVELALGPNGRRHDRPAEERGHILALYREAIDPSTRRPVIALAPEERAPIDPDAPAFENFARRWPGTLRDNRQLTAQAWRELSAAEQAAAIAGIEPYFAARRDAHLLSIPAGARYLKERLWIRVA